MRIYGLTYSLYYPRGGFRLQTHASISGLIWQLAYGWRRTADIDIESTLIDDN